ncbi:MAG: hypothetical protein AAF970_09285 [Bacteroidota bacterium]
MKRLTPHLGLTSLLILAVLVGGGCDSHADDPQAVDVQVDADGDRPLSIRLDLAPEVDPSAVPTVTVDLEPFLDEPDDDPGFLFLLRILRASLAFFVGEDEAEIGYLFVEPTASGAGVVLSLPLSCPEEEVVCFPLSTAQQRQAVPVPVPLLTLEDPTSTTLESAIRPFTVGTQLEGEVRVRGPEGTLTIPAPALGVEPILRVDPSLGQVEVTVQRNRVEGALFVALVRGDETDAEALEPGQETATVFLNPLEGDLPRPADLYVINFGDTRWFEADDQRPVQ